MKIQNYRIKLLALAVAVVMGLASCGDSDSDIAEEAEFTEETDAEEDDTEQHEAIDLGLSVLWATCNVGADSPEDYGSRYAWGETSTKSSYTIGNCETWEEDIDDISGTDRDVAYVKWGMPWRMPTRAEFYELVNNCDWEWTTQGGIRGCKVTGKNGNSIFLPAAGERAGKSYYDTGDDGYYWSSTPHGSSTQMAYYLGFGSDYQRTNAIGRAFGHSVRPVTE